MGKSLAACTVVEAARRVSRVRDGVGESVADAGAPEKVAESGQPRVLGSRRRAVFAGVSVGGVGVASSAVAPRVKSVRPPA